MSAKRAGLGEPSQRLEAHPRLRKVGVLHAGADDGALAVGGAQPGEGAGASLAVPARALALRGELPVLGAGRVGLEHQVLDGRAQLPLGQAEAEELEPGPGVVGRLGGGDPLLEATLVVLERAARPVALEMQLEGQRFEPLPARFELSEELVEDTLAREEQAVPVGEGRAQLATH
ncbi:MAG TPA: hypothetical protein RMH26_12025, partial [Polyangiaceae bacterium LLY-WYZ-15_(1-7)]|nr:hypothetical protein [Polyangiaceae bacterium LLY-WYZ-15_(1-7)]